jgi:4'-phosphopantetheinyl transferase EntD
MGVIRNEHIEEDCIIGLWEINETFDILYSLVNLDKDEKDTLFNFKNDDRQLEWLSVRALLNQIVKKEARIIYNQERKPFLQDNSYNISISHSHNLTSILLSEQKSVGIDLEFMSHRINKIAHKFINVNEHISNVKELEKIHLYIHWCAKEALYKICDKKNINFKENLTIKPFEIQQEGCITGIHHDKGICDEFSLKYHVYDNYVIVYCTK